MDLADLVMNYPRVKAQIKAFQDECGSNNFKKYQVKWLWPRWFPFTIRCQLRYLPSLREGTFEQVLPLSIKP
ncbi:MAG: hypothetical protein AAFV46_00880 [Cyanobacteria bacterium J06635_11]